MKRFLVLMFLIVLACLPASTGSVTAGTQACPSSGNQALSTSVVKMSWIIFTTGTLSGKISIGDSGVTTSKGATIGSNTILTFHPLANTQPYNLSQIYIACSNSADSIQYTYLQ